MNNTNNNQLGGYIRETSGTENTIRVRITQDGKIRIFNK